MCCHILKIYYNELCVPSFACVFVYFSFFSLISGFYVRLWCRVKHANHVNLFVFAGFCRPCFDTIGYASGGYRVLIVTVIGMITKIAVN